MSLSVCFIIMMAFEFGFTSTIYYLSNSIGKSMIKHLKGKHNQRGCWLSKPWSCLSSLSVKRGAERESTPRAARDLRATEAT